MKDTLMGRNQGAPKTRHAFLLARERLSGSSCPRTSLWSPRVPEKVSKPKRESVCKLGPCRGNWWDLKTQIREEETSLIFAERNSPYSCEMIHWQLKVKSMCVLQCSSNSVFVKCVWTWAISRWTSFKSQSGEFLFIETKYWLYQKCCKWLRGLLVPTEKLPSPLCVLLHRAPGRKERLFRGRAMLRWCISHNKIAFAHTQLMLSSTFYQESITWISIEFCNLQSSFIYILIAFPTIYHASAVIPNLQLKSKKRLTQVEVWKTKAFPWCLRRPRS